MSTTNEFQEREKKIKELYSQGPVLNGAIYCSPWCGFKCTKEAHDRAVRNAQELADQLGEPWKPRVWENGDWHYSAKCGESQVHVRREGGYWASIMVGVDEATRTGGIQYIGEGETPIEAVMDALKRIERARNDLNEAIHKFRGA